MKFRTAITWFLFAKLVNGFSIGDNKPSTRQSLMVSRAPFMASAPALHENDLNIVDVLAETEAALKLAEESIEAAKKDSMRAEGASASIDQQEIIASGIGGFGLGLVLGTAALGQVPETIDQIIEPSLITTLTAAIVGAAAVSASYSDGLVGTMTRTVLGKSTMKLGNIIKQSCEDGLSALATSAQKQLNNSVDHVKQLPSKTAKKLQDTSQELLNASVQKIEDTVEEGMAIPGKIAKAANKAIEETAEGIKSAPNEILETATMQIQNSINRTPLLESRVAQEVSSISNSAMIEKRSQSSDLENKSESKLDDDTVVKFPDRLFSMPLMWGKRKPTGRRSFTTPTPPVNPPPLNLL